MGKLRFFIAMLAAKAAYYALKLLGRNASCTPGMIALKLDKQFLGKLTPPKTVIAVTGTNGKTTVSNLVANILSDNGYKVTNNSIGSNIQAGVTTALLQDSTITGNPKKDIAVLEVDERSALLVYPYLKPDYLICNNIMRDSLKRNAHTDFIKFILSKAMPEETHLFLNADDLICSTIAPQCNKRTYFSIDAEKPENEKTQYVRDIVYCPDCGSALEADYIRYNHIGRMHCSQCNYASPTPDFTVTNIDRVNKTFTVAHDGEEKVFNLINDNIVNIYNFCGVVSLLTTLGLSYEQIQAGFAKSKIVKSRYDYLESGKLKITMQLAKGQNPIACARCYSYVSKCPGQNKGLIILVDDKGDNTRNSESTCWLYDCDYSYLAHPSIGQIVFAGPRCKDQYLRALLAGVPGEKIRLIDSPSAGADLLDIKNIEDVFVLYDPYLLSEAKAVKERLIQLGMEAENSGN